MCLVSHAVDRPCLCSFEGHTDPVLGMEGHRWGRGDVQAQALEAQVHHDLCSVGIMGL